MAARLSLRTFRQKIGETSHCPVSGDACRAGCDAQLASTQGKLQQQSPRCYLPVPCYWSKRRYRKR